MAQAGRTFQLRYIRVDGGPRIVMGGGYVMEILDGETAGRWDVRGASTDTDTPLVGGEHDVLVVTSEGVMLRGQATITSGPSASGRGYDVRFLGRPREGATFDT